MQSPINLSLNQEQLAKMQGSLAIHSAVDLGPCLVQHGSHPHAGYCTVVSTCEGTAVLITDFAHEAVAKQFLNF